VRKAHAAVRKTHASALVRQAPANGNGPAVEDIGAAVYVIPTDWPEADGTLAWDLKARLLGLPVASLLGRARRDVPVYGSGGFTSYDEHQTREQLSGWVQKDGIPRVKIKIGESWGGNERRDIERVALAREVIGPQAELYVDANGGYTTGQAVRVAREMADYDVTWFEEALAPDPGQPGLGLQLRTADAERYRAELMHADLPRGRATLTLPPGKIHRRTDR
jgi:hypothetical protein